MSTELVKKIARREIREIESGGRLDLVEELFTSDFRLHFPGYPTMDRAGFKALISAFRQGFPDLTVIPIEQVAEQNRVANRLAIRGTHLGEFNGVPASGRTIEIGAINVMRFEGDQIAELWGHLDLMGLLQQIGAMAAPAEKGA